MIWLNPTTPIYSEASPAHPGLTEEHHTKLMDIFALDEDWKFQTKALNRLISRLSDLIGSRIPEFSKHCTTKATDTAQYQDAFPAYDRDLYCQIFATDLSKLFQTSHDIKDLDYGSPRIQKIFALNRILSHSLQNKKDKLIAAGITKQQVSTAFADGVIAAAQARGERRTEVLVARAIEAAWNQR